MPAYKEKDRNTWTVKIKHRNWSGQIKWVTKRGFATKREALQYERDFLARKSGNLDMSFADFVQVYREERGARIKESTLGKLTSIHQLSASPTLRRANRIRTIHGSLAIEQNTLSLEQVTAVINGKHVLAPPKDIAEVKNAYEIYERLLCCFDFS